MHLVILNTSLNYYDSGREEAGRRLILSRRGSGMALQVSLTLLNESKQAAELMQSRSIRGS